MKGQSYAFPVTIFKVRGNVMAERRRQYYTDQKIQGYLLAGLIVIEVSLVIVLMYFLYGDVNELIEQNIYQIHTRGSDSWGQIFSLVTIAIVSFLAINVVLMFLAHRVWSRYIQSTISQFSLVLDRILGFEFDAPLHLGDGNHQMMQLVQKWFDKEKKRHDKVDRLLERLSRFEGSSLNENEQQQLKKTLQEYRKTLTDTSV